MAKRYTLAIEIDKEDKCNSCPINIKNQCIYHKLNDKRHKSNCKMHTAINPFCLVDNNDPCINTREEVLEDGRRFIFYKCGNCPYLMKLTAKERENLLKKLNRKDVYAGKRLSEITKLIEKKKEDSGTKKLIDEIITIVANNNRNYVYEHSDRIIESMRTFPW